MPNVDARVQVAHAHHFVPQVYLREWAEGARVAVRRRDRADPFVANTSKVLQERDLYTVDHPGMSQDAIESALSEYEGQIPRMLRQLRLGHVPPIGSADRKSMATLVAIQQARTPDRLVLFRLPELAVGRAGTAGRITDALVIELFEQHVGRSPATAELKGLRVFLEVMTQPGERFDTNMVVGTMFGPVERAARLLEDMVWTVEQTKGVPFLTSDTPVHLWCRRPPLGTGVGLTNADEVRYPIGPRHLLVLKRRGAEGSVPVKRSRVEAVNRHTCATSWQTVVGHPSEIDMLTRAELKPVRPLLIALHIDAVQEYRDGQDRDVGLLQVMRPYDDGSAMQSS